MSSCGADAATISQFFKDGSRYNKRTAISAILVALGKNAFMRHKPDAELLQAMRESLRGLDTLKLLSPDDVEIQALRRTLREKIAELEQQQEQRRKTAA